MKQPPPPPIPLEHTGEKTLEFLDGNQDLSWNLDSEAQRVIYMDNVRTTEGPEKAPMRIIMEHITLHFRLPFQWMWRQPPADDSNGDPSEDPSKDQPSSQASSMPPRCLTGPRIIPTAWKSVLCPGRHRGEPSAAPVAIISPTASTEPAPSSPPLPMSGTTQVGTSKMISIYDPLGHSSEGIRFQSPSSDDWKLKSKDLEDTSSNSSSPDSAGGNPSKRPRIDQQVVGVRLGRGIVLHSLFLWLCILAFFWEV